MPDLADLSSDFPNPRDHRDFQVAAYTIKSLKTRHRTALNQDTARNALAQLKQIRKALDAIHPFQLRQPKSKVVYFGLKDGDGDPDAIPADLKLVWPLSQSELDRLIREVDLCIFQLERTFPPRPISDAVKRLLRFASAGFRVERSSTQTPGTELAKA